MADEIDVASAHEEMTLQQALEAQRLRAQTTKALAALGYCLSPRCGEEFPPGDARLFCGPYCAAIHQRFSNH